MRILILTTGLSLEPNDGNLTNDLVMALAECGHEVQVVLLDWNSPLNSPPRSLKLAPGVNVLAQSPRAITVFGKFFKLGTKWLCSTWFAQREMKRQFKGQQFDLAVGFAPACLMRSQNVLAQRISKRSYLILWDFFPFHHRSIGLIKYPIVFKIAYWLENRYMQFFDTIGCMTPANEAYLKNRFHLRPGQQTEILPIWGPTTAPKMVPREGLRSDFGLPLDKKIVVFGGQLSVGRGLEEILAAAEHSVEHYPELAFLIIGQGALAEMVSERVARSGTNIIYRKRVPRERYLELLTACDAGLVCTVPNVDVPTFPSKTIDYLRAGIPIIASVEASTDFGMFIEDRKLGIACQAGDAEALAATASRVVGNAVLTAEIGERARDCLNSVFDVRHTAERLIAFGTGASAT